MLEEFIILLMLAGGPMGILTLLTLGGAVRTYLTNPERKNKP